MIVHYSEASQESIFQYYERYENLYGHRYTKTDLRYRADNWRYLRDFMFHIESNIDDAYVNNNITYIKVSNICIIDFVLNKEGELLIRNIYFEDTSYTNDDIHQPASHKTNSVQQLNASKAYTKSELIEIKQKRLIENMVRDILTEL
jgi:hypothetical protein